VKQIQPLILTPVIGAKVPDYQNEMQKASRFSLQALRRNPAFTGFQGKLGQSAKEMKIIIEKLWLND
jgi:hypothetical protein